jgi:hypothetical protein
VQNADVDQQITEPLALPVAGFERFPATGRTPSYWVVQPLAHPDGRPNAARPAVVLHDLRDLRGPAGGVVPVPAALHAEVGRDFDAGDAAQRRHAYAAIFMAAATTADDLADLVNIEHLLDDFEELPIARPWLRAWQTLHPDCHAEVHGTPA